ncbi:MAG: hypothetical protein RJB39_659 [Candidatus Parcubacteria bacterium]|jgi:hypothetical protein
MKKITIFIIVLAAIVAVVWQSQKFMKTPSAAQTMATTTSDMSEPIAPKHAEDMIPVSPVSSTTLQAVKTSLIGKWQNLEDVKFTREFKANGMFVDSYEGQPVPTHGEWKAFTKEQPLSWARISLEVGSVYVQFDGPDSPDGAFVMKVIKVTPDELELGNMSGGPGLRLKKI